MYHRSAKITQVDQTLSNTTRPDKPVESRYMTLAEAGRYCGGRSAEAMRKLAQRGRIPVIKLGKSLLMDKLDIDTIMHGAKLPIPAL